MKEIKDKTPSNAAELKSKYVGNYVNAVIKLGDELCAFSVSMIKKDMYVMIEMTKNPQLLDRIKKIVGANNYDKIVN